MLNKIFPNIHGIGTDTIRNIKQIKSNRKAFIQGPKPLRVMKILENSKKTFDEYSANDNDKLKNYKHSK